MKPPHICDIDKKNPMLVKVRIQIRASPSMVLPSWRETLPEDMRKSANLKVGDFMIVKYGYGEFTLTVAKVEPRKAKKGKQ